VDDDEQAERRAQAEQHESILVVDVVRIADEQALLVREGAGGFDERDGVLALVGLVLAIVPLEMEVGLVGCSVPTV